MMSAHAAHYANLGDYFTRARSNPHENNCPLNVRIRNEIRQSVCIFPVSRVKGWIFECDLAVSRNARDTPTSFNSWTNCTQSAAGSNRPVSNANISQLNGAALFFRSILGIHWIQSKIGPQLWLYLNYSDWIQWKALIWVKVYCVRACLIISQHCLGSSMNVTIHRL